MVVRPERPWKVQLLRPRQSLCAANDVQHPLLLLAHQEKVELVVQKLAVAALPQITACPKQVVVMEARVTVTRPLRVRDDDRRPLASRPGQVGQELEQGVQTRRVPKKLVAQTQSEPICCAQIGVGAVVQEHLPVPPLA